MKQATAVTPAAAKAMQTRSTQLRLARGPQSFRFRLNAIAFAGQRPAKVWERV